ncbi:hypothetical protein F2P56_026577 [Juglans regia]|uniref:Uncharacterized protein LOC108998283 n=2 Tax=Juglans regia TaxID=51240 RepID=A0A2I4FFC3_JUGRE|nr:uncharacterized protein LOC108998283 [Juglans regia]XP_018830349.1 uncharacterized protein LOC108998283 [Juglans regia]XP_035539732.1 uncharacterized protein LOC108998283 [Juglans regia]XP_035539733.1 uncharacterized protein LOC108998283 [Juglans regia]XP_035539734.1 uncharacterized protein LOC108998283 [Juglans regia]XP_035539735.1 uncharacterized protein LOC108998283 [Juglans regia]XP_035539736.1 uncharacterized protein LOC108998283 [Juglans regia]KAF5451471.1 hypothetical protein F2P56
MERAPTRTESEYLLGLSAHFLTLRNLPMCRQYALRVRESGTDKHSVSEQILAIADVLLAAENRLFNRHLDYLSILQIRRADSGNRHLVQSQYEKLAALLNPNVNKFAFSPDALGLVWEAWSVLSDPEKKAQYENEIGIPEKRNEHKEKKGTESEGTDTFWTLCPYCYCMYEYEKDYEGCCLRCQNCRRAYHGMAVNAPPKSILVEEGTGKERYHCCWAYFPLGYNKGAESRRKGNAGIDVGRERRNVNTVARKTNNIMRSRRNGLGRTNSNLEFGEASGSGNGEGGLEFYEGDDDVYVGIVATP